MTLDEIPNDITKKTPCSFEPTIDYVVAKIPKWQFEKFPGSDTTLSTQMKSVGEVMAIGRTFKEALGKGIRSLEPQLAVAAAGGSTTVRCCAKNCTCRGRTAFTGCSLRWSAECTREEVCDLTKIDPWFIQQMQEMMAVDRRVAADDAGNCAGGIAAGSQALGRRATSNSRKCGT